MSGGILARVERFRFSGMDGLITEDRLCDIPPMTQTSKKLESNWEDSARHKALPEEKQKILDKGALEIVWDGCLGLCSLLFITSTKTKFCGGYVFSTVGLSCLFVCLFVIRIIQKVMKEFR